MSMELKIQNPTSDMKLDKVEWNFEELKNQIAEKTQVYKAMVISESQIREAKDYRASLNRLKKAFDEKRLSIKKMYLEPYEEFEAGIKQLVKMIDESAKNLDVQIKVFEDVEREQKLNAAKEELLEAAARYGLVEFKPAGGWELLVDQRWGNKSTSAKSISTDIDEKLSLIKSDLETIEGLADHPFRFEVYEYYTRSLSLGEALKEGERLKRLDEEKQAYAERQQSLLEAARSIPEDKPKPETVHATQVIVRPSPQPEPQATHVAEEVYTLRFEVSGSRDQLMSLSAFMKDNGISYTQIKGE